MLKPANSRQEPLNSNFKTGKYLNIKKMTKPLIIIFKSSLSTLKLRLAY